VSAKYTTASSATAGDRLTNVDLAATQLSTGDLVQLVYDPTAADPNKVSLQVVVGHTAPSVIGYISSDIFNIGGVPQSLTLCRDNKDNIYVIGAYALATNNLCAQAFIKGSGLAWTPKFAVADRWSGGTSPSYSYGAFAATWCNTGGGTAGAGQIYLLVNDTANQPHQFALDAGLILAPAPGPQSLWSFTRSRHEGVAGSAFSGGNMDISPDGFGASSGILMIGKASGAGNVTIRAWGIVPGGTLTTGGGLFATVNGGTLTATTRCRIVRYAPNRWGAVYPSATHAGQLTVQGCSASALTGASVDTGTASNFPAPSATLSWGAQAAPPSAATVWVYGWSSLTATTMLRVPVTFDASGAPTLGAVVTDDTTVGTAPGHLRTAHDLVDFQHADWQTNDLTGSTRALLGDYSALPAPPPPVSLLSPADGASTPAASTFSWQFNPAFSGDAQTVYYFRRSVAGGAYQWWDGAAWQSTEQAVTSASSSIAFAAFGTAGTTYSWSVDVKGAGGTRAGYSNTQSVGIALASPATPTLTASYDPVTNKTTLTLHTTDATGPNGSIEYSDDGGSTWNFVHGASALTINPGTATVFDYSTPITTRQYRGQSWTVYPFGYSAYATASVAGATAGGYWLKDITDGTIVKLKVKPGSMGGPFVEDLTLHYGLGAKFPIPVAGMLHGEDGGATLQTSTAAEQVSLLTLLNRQTTLLFQAPDAQWFIRVTSPHAVNKIRTIVGNYLRETAVAWVEVATPA
jgi:hypothetical protein